MVVFFRVTVTFHFYASVISLELKCLNQYLYKLISTYVHRWISKIRWMKNDDKNKKHI
jgi:hypothetical protein